MCDTIGRITSEDAVLFAKNSDRHPKEIQVLEYASGSLESVRNPILEKYSPQFTTLEKVHKRFEHPYNALISRPSWIWGAEMGVNEKGVVLGNEAVFTKQKIKKDGLLGMDILRLTLHNCTTAQEALTFILELLDQWGQGGDGSFIGKLTYSNSFIVGDPKSLFVLETAGPRWAIRQIKDHGSISNAYSLGYKVDKSDAVSMDKHFGKLWRDGFMEFFSKGRVRQRKTLELAGTVEASWMGMRDVLCYNRGTLEKPDRSMKSIAIDASFPKPTRTTASLIVEYPDDEILAWTCPSPLPQYHPFIPLIVGYDLADPRDPYEAATRRQDITNALLRASTEERVYAATSARSLEKEFEKRIRTALGDEPGLKKAVALCWKEALMREDELLARLGI